MQVHLTSTTAALYQFKYPTLAPVAALVRLARSWWIVATQLLVRSPGHNGTPTPLCISSIGVVELRPPPPTESPEFTVEVGDVPMFWLYMWWYWYMRYMIPYMMICNMWYVIQEYTVYMITVLFCGSLVHVLIWHWRFHQSQYWQGQLGAWSCHLTLAPCARLCPAQAARSFWLQRYGVSIPSKVGMKSDSWMAYVHLSHPALRSWLWTKVRCDPGWSSLGTGFVCL